MLKSTKTANKASDLLGRLFGWLPLEPNSITITSIFVAFLAFVAYDGSLEGKAMSLILFLIAFGLDAADGAIARAKNKVTKEGAFIDGIADRMVEFFLILAILRMFPFNADMQAVLFSILFFGTCMTVFVKAYAEHKGMLPHERAEGLPGILERAERSVLLLLAFVLLVVGYPVYGTYVLYITAALSFLTFAQRFFTVLYGKK